MKFIDLKEHLKQNNLQPIYVMYGDDQEVLNIAQNLFVKLIDPSFIDFNFNVFDVQETEPQKIIDACNTLPLMAQKKLVILNDTNAKEEKKDSEKSKTLTYLKLVLDYLKQPQASTILVVKTSENSSAFNKLKTLATLIDCNKLDPLTLKKYILRECKNKKVEIGDKEILKLIEICGSNLGYIISETQKLIAFSDNKVITLEDIENNCTKNLEYSVFELTESLSHKNAQKSIEILDDMLKNPKNQPLILPLISAHMRRLFMIATSNASLKEKAAMLGVKEYAVQKSEMLIRSFSKKKLLYINKLINECEFNIKSGKAALIDTLYYIVMEILSS